jgi:hypothetical protein
VLRSDITVLDYDDDQMASAQAVENATQRGSSMAKMLDAVAGITSRVAYHALKQDGTGKGDRFTPDQLSQIVSAIKNGDGVGREAVVAFAPKGAIGENDVREAIATLKSSGMMAEVIDQAAQALRDEAQYARVKAKLAESKAKTPQAKGKATRATKEAEALTETAKTAEAAAEAADDQDVTFDAEVATLFPNRSQLAHFRKAVTGESARAVIDVGSQFELADEIIRAAAEKAGISGHADDTHHLTGPFIRDCVNNAVRKGLGLKREMDRETRDRHEAAIARVAAERLVGELAKSYGQLSARMEEIVARAGDGLSFDSVAVRLDEVLQQAANLAGEVQAVRDATGVHHHSKTVTV